MTSYKRCFQTALVNIHPIRQKCAVPLVLNEFSTHIVKTTLSEVLNQSYDVSRNFLSDFLSGNEEFQEAPPVGDCATCLGVVDDTLGTCSNAKNCVSTYDDRQAF